MTPLPAPPPPERAPRPGREPAPIGPPRLELPAASTLAIQRKVVVHGHIMRRPPSVTRAELRRGVRS